VAAIQVRPLPYTGHKWFLTQHEVGINPKTLYKMLQLASPYEGQRRAYSKKITNLMVTDGVLTTNVRNGIADAWRDYQQLLPTLGLIYSTKIQPTLTFTDLGHMFLAGEMGFSELVGIQSLRLQYPNGNVFARIKSAQQDDADLEPNDEKLTVLQVQQGVLIKPGLLILRVLIELLKQGLSPSLSAKECEAYLLPCRVNADWHLAVSEIVRHRKADLKINFLYPHATRSVHGWFKLLWNSDFFTSIDMKRIPGRPDPNMIALSTYALDHVGFLEALCTSQEDVSTFWIPTNLDAADQLRWFDWFGQVPLEAQSALRTDLSLDYVRHNYIAGLEDIEDEEIQGSGSLSLNLGPVDLDRLARSSDLQSSQDINTLIENLRAGAQKRHAKTLLHDKIVKALAEKFIAQGATVEADQDSIDLFAKWPTGDTAIFEVKTITRRNLGPRLRMAVGQVEEYAYRHRCLTGATSDRVVVVNADIKSTAWQTSFLTDYLGIGLICKPANNYSAFAPAGAKTRHNWLQ
jgi:hypothetical protein